MKIPELDTEEIMHIIELLREDLMVNRKMLDEHPLDEAAMDSFFMSRDLLKRIACNAIIITYEPSTMATRPERN